MKMSAKIKYLCLMISFSAMSLCFAQTNPQTNDKAVTATETSVDTEATPQSSNRARIDTLTSEATSTSADHPVPDPAQDALITRNIKSLLSRSPLLSRFDVNIK